MKSEAKSVKELYCGAEIFITGASGFIGKVLVEKLLRSCPDVKEIYLLMRPKKGQTGEDRIQQLTDNLVFSQIRRENADAFKKLHAIGGDIRDLRLGMSDADRERLNACSIIVHLAASVRFDDHLKDAILMNTRGTREVCEFAKTLKNLKAFVHVSTAFVQPHNLHIEEKLFRTDCDWKSYIKMAESLDVDLINSLSLKLSKFAPCTYTFTKLLAEQICDDYRREWNLPISIYRPSIVSFCDAEIRPGWSDTINGANGMFIAYFSGIKRVSNAKFGALDMIPVDICAKGIIVASAKDQKTEEALPDIPIYNAASLVTISMHEMLQLVKPLHENHLFEKSIGLPSMIITKCDFFAAILIFFLQIIPAVLIDSYLKLNKKKPQLMKFQRLLYSAEITASFFIHHKFTFATENFLQLGWNVHSSDKKDFSMQPQMDKLEYFRQGYFVSKEIILNETEQSEVRAKKRVPYWKALSVVIKAMFYAILYNLAIYFVKFVKTSF